MDTTFLWVLDSRTLPFFFLLVLHTRWWVFWFLMVVVVFFSAISRFGFPLRVFLRWVRHRLVGRYRSARPWWYLKRFSTRVI